MHGYRIFHWDDLNRNGNLKEWKLIIHGYTNLNGGDLNEDETLKKKLMYFIRVIFGIEELT